MKTKKELEKKLEKQLDALSEKIDRLEAKMNQEQKRAGEIEEKAVHNLIAMRSKARTKLHRFKEAGEDTWEELSDHLERYWESVGIEIKAYEDL